MLCLTRSHIRTVHAYIRTARVLYSLERQMIFLSIDPGYGNRNSDRGDPSCPEGGEAAMFVLGPRSGHVTCATECEIGLALVEDSPEKSTEGQHRDHPRHG